jgi:hypothetical protein
MDLKKEVKLSWDPVLPECGTYDFTIGSSATGLSYIKFSTEKQFTVEIQAP